MQIKLAQDPLITIAEGPGAESKKWRNKQYRLSDFFAKLQKVKRVTETQEQYFALKNSPDKAKKKQADRIKDRAGGFVGGELDRTGYRQQKNVVNRILLTYDFDCGVPMFLLPGICCAAYTTFRHRSTFPRFRTVALLSRPVGPKEYERLSRLFVWDVAEWLDMDPEILFSDDTTHSPEHFFYWPSAPCDGEALFDYQDGQPLDVDRILDTDRDPFYPKSKETAGNGSAPLAPGEKVPEGKRYPHLVSRARTLVNVMWRTCTDDAILAALWQVAHDECEGTIDGEDFSAFCEVYRDAIRKFRRSASEDDFDYSAAAGVYFRAHPGESLPVNARGKIDWKAVRMFAAEHEILNGTTESTGSGGGRNHDGNDSQSLKPSVFTDLAQAKVFCSVYGERVRFSRATGFMVYDGKRWKESAERARGLVHKFVDAQLKDAGREVRQAQEAENTFIESLRGEAIEKGSEEDMQIQALKAAVKAAQGYRAAVLKYQGTTRISAILQEAAPMVCIETDDLDSDPYLLNTPEGTVNLRSGRVWPHCPGDYITKIAACGPSDKNMDEWMRFLDQVTGGNEELRDYLQICFGMAALGEVRQEKLLIPYGSGGNGKSTTCNAVAEVLGDYSGTLSADALTMNSRKNVSPEYAELRGKRLVIASELSEGMRLNTSVVKQLCSTDRITGEKKYKDPFSFRPSHTLFLFTNHLPKVGTNDGGTWARLVVIPFKGQFRNTNMEIMNYAAELSKRCGGAILTWVCEGARKFIDSGFRLPCPQVVQDAISAYQADNDWLGNFIEARCEEDLHYSVGAADLYREYDDYCRETGDYKRSVADFKAALENVNILWHRTNRGAFYWGIRVREDARRPVNSTE